MFNNKKPPFFPQCQTFALIFPRLAFDKVLADFKGMLYRLKTRILQLTQLMFEIFTCTFFFLLQNLNRHLWEFFLQTSFFTNFLLCFCFELQPAGILVTPPPGFIILVPWCFGCVIVCTVIITLLSFDLKYLTAYLNLA